MEHRKERHAAPPTSVSIALVLEAQPSRAAAFKTACAALLHAGFNFGRTHHGHIVSSLDAAAETYAAPISVPVGTVATMSDALAHLGTVANHYNRSVSLGFEYDEGAVPVTCRTYDESGWMSMTLDFEHATWRRLVGHFRSVRGATTALVDVSKTLFTLVPMTYLVIGPSRSLDDLPRVPTPTLLRTTPVAMVAHRDQPAQPTHSTVVEQLPRGSVVVRQWDATTLVRPPRATKAKAHPSV